MKPIPTEDGTWIDRETGETLKARTREEAQREIARRIDAKKGRAA